MDIDTVLNGFAYFLRPSLLLWGVSAMLAMVFLQSVPVLGIIFIIIGSLAFLSFVAGVVGKGRQSSKNRADRQT